MGKERAEKYPQWTFDGMMRLYPEIPRCPICHHADYSNEKLDETIKSRKPKKKKGVKA
jgi:hypothetical protein